MTEHVPNESPERTGPAPRSSGAINNDVSSGRRVLATYAAMGSGSFELLTALLGRAIDATKRWPEPWRRILWGQQR